MASNLYEAVLDYCRLEEKQQEQEAHWEEFIQAKAKELFKYQETEIAKRIAQRLNLNEVFDNGESN